jgi:hypothetical protein
MWGRKFRGAVAFLVETPETLRQLTIGWACDELKWKPSGGEFSALEHVCHLRDLEREAYGARVEKMLGENEPLLPDFDGARAAAERDYMRQDFERAFEDFSVARAENLRVAKSLSAEELARRGVLEGVGAITLRDLFLLMREHDRAHLKELKKLRGRLPRR